MSAREILHYISCRASDWFRSPPYFSRRGMSSELLPTLEKSIPISFLALFPRIYALCVTFWSIRKTWVYFRISENTEAYSVSVPLCPKIAVYLFYVCQGSAVQTTFVCRSSVRHITTEGRMVSVSLVVAIRGEWNGSWRYWIKLLSIMYLFRVHL
jgi:hypothetical protein